jgi:hypothetical protein
MNDIIQIESEELYILRLDQIEKLKLNWKLIVIHSFYLKTQIEIELEKDLILQEENM